MAFDTETRFPEEVTEPFQSVPESMFTLFRVMSSAASEQEAHAIDAVLEAAPTLKFAFVFFMITSSWTLLSILTAVVSENMLTSTGEQARAMKLQCDEEDRALHISKLQELFDAIDYDNNTVITQAEINRFLGERERRHRASKDTGIPIHSVKEVLGTLAGASESHTISKQLFVDYLIDAANNATEKSMMKLEFHLKSLFDEVLRRLSEVNEKVQEWQTHELTVSGKNSVPQCSHVQTAHGAELHEQSKKGNGYMEHPFEHIMQAYDKYNQQMLAKTEEAQRKHIDFLESLQSRWQGLEDLSVGLAVDRLACALNGLEPLGSNGELRFNYGTTRHDYVAGHPLPSTAVRQERTSGQAVHHPPAATTVEDQSRQLPRELLQQSRTRTSGEAR